MMSNSRKKKDINVKENFREVMDGSLLTREKVIKQLPFIIFLTVLGLIYIANRYHAEKVFVMTEETREDIHELRSEKISVQSELMEESRESKVLKMLDAKGSELKTADEPPVKISYEEEK